MAGGLDFSLYPLPDFLIPLRTEVRTFLAEASKTWSPEVRGHSWTGFDRGFSEELGRRGWIGMTWPTRFGGHERSAIERYVVLEELLAAGAPCGAHWIADRQSGPLLIRHGTARQQALLPAIAQGRLSFCIGMSEPDAGSDLAAIRSRATKVAGGWRLDGRKVWTTNAHLSDWMIGLFRSGSAEELRHAGLSQFLIDLRSSGISIRPIRDLTGHEDFNEVTFDEVFVPDGMIVGAEGNGWAQVTSELTLERSGPERYLTTFPLVAAAAGEIKRETGRPSSDVSLEGLGRLVAHHAVLREMSLAVSGALERGEEPATQAAMVKDLGNDLEQRVPGIVRELLDAPPPGTSSSDVDRLLSFVTQAAPSYSLRGGTREILRGIIAKGLGLR
jgi:alkylation response protein AidB-like acyl-CoA dehydrogenase